MAGELIADAIKDSGLSYADTNGTRIDICSTAPTNYTQATSTYTLGNKTGLNTSAPADAAAGTGREVTVPAITNGSVTGTGTAGFWALTDGASIFLAAGPLSATQAVTSGNTFTLDAIKIIIRDATVT